MERPERNSNDFEVIANWWLNPRAVRACLRKMFGRSVPGKLDRTADWQVLHWFEHGVTSYDYEEGIKFDWDLAHLQDLVDWVKAYHRLYGIPFEYDGRAMFVAQLKCSGHSRDGVFQACGLTKSTKFYSAWELRESDVRPRTLDGYESSSLPSSPTEGASFSRAE